MDMMTIRMKIQQGTMVYVGSAGLHISVCANLGLSANILEGEVRYRSSYGAKKLVNNPFNDDDQNDDDQNENAARCFYDAISGSIRL